jgi:hypothetical protein
MYKRGFDMNGERSHLTCGFPTARGVFSTTNSNSVHLPWRYRLAASQTESDHEWKLAPSSSIVLPATRV